MNNSRFIWLLFLRKIGGYTMKIKNEAMLITYCDSLGNNLKDLNKVLDKHLNGVVGGIHLLPFFP